MWLGAFLLSDARDERCIPANGLCGLVGIPTVFQGVDRTIHARDFWVSLFQVGTIMGWHHPTI